MAQRCGWQHHAGIVNFFDALPLINGNQLRLTAAQRRVRGKLAQQAVQAGDVVIEHAFIVAAAVSQHVQRQAALFVRKERNLQIVDRACRQCMGLSGNPVNIQQVIEHFDVKHRAKERLIPGSASGITLDLFGIVTLMAAHLFQLPGKGIGQFRQGLHLVYMHTQRQHIEHRPGCGQRR